MEMCERYLFLLMVNKFTVTRQGCLNSESVVFMVLQRQTFSAATPFITLIVLVTVC